jgi:hypothetical protein
MIPQASHQVLHLPNLLIRVLTAILTVRVKILVGNLIGMPLSARNHTVIILKRKRTVNLSPDILGHSKAIKPNEYNGAPDARAYHRFMKESSAYIEDSGISRKRQCFALSYYLTDKAYDFYQQKVSMTEEKWTLEEFYTELFNFCFPINYRTQMRKKLDHLFQKEKSVNEYAFELEEIFNMIGGFPNGTRLLNYGMDFAVLFKLPFTTIN